MSQILKPKKGYKLVKELFGKDIEIPEEWNVLEFRNIARVKRGASPRPIEDPKYFGQGRGWVRISDVSKSNKYLKQTRDYLSKLGESKSVAVNEGDIIMSIAATVGKPIIVKMKACIHDGFVTFSNLSDKIDNEFLYYLLKKIENKFTGIGQHGTQSNINSAIVSKTKFYSPPLLEQQKIASILSNIDNTIINTQKIIDQTTLLKKGLMQKLLTKGISHTKFKKIIFSPRHISFKIPEDWEVKTMNKILITDPQNGINVRLENYGSGVPIFEINSLYNSEFTINQSNLRNALIENEKELKRYVLLENNFLINRVSKVKEGVGKMLLVLKPIKNLIYEGNMIRIIINQELIVPEFLEFLSKSNLYLRYIQSTCKTTSLTSIDQGIITKIPILIPSINEQQKIASILSNVDSQITSQTQYKEKLERLKKSLMQKLLTGEVRVKI